MSQVLERPPIRQNRKRSHLEALPEGRPRLFAERPGEVRLVPCNACGGSKFKKLFYKESSLRETFQVVRCSCGLVQVNPQPDLKAIMPYYTDAYFKKRTDRGYDNYYSEALRDEIRRVFTLNLADLDFFTFEEKALKSGSNHALDVGCAAGYFVEYMAERAWRSRGIELSRSAGTVARKRGLDVTIGDFLTSSELSPSSYDLVSFWASIEHMHDPASVLRRAYEILKPGGRMLLSTCRYGILARIRGKDWRYMNVPEHLYFFSLRGLSKMARGIGFQVVRTVTYGSGMTTRKDGSELYATVKRYADPAVKFLNQGDMMAFHLEKMS
ncbi:MAG: class I SAM-dependent methyltransferase [Spirochaetia bacterium]|nr:class I SAM-dependent methyltransferase [Spirochaetia bacterium]